ncbi:hypothetical protein RA086_10655 [Lactiplantibacillus sp. WILCCON 0030]|uniref:Uncharacterized protein n=1 Tax=Lactiplantibacillus brownii TaxID=3069269 RepID=A0ABU1ABQ6_9LACO|nr:hypothetical protein [Lactiplantibacillus brownii]MDQ7938070.1 hypothetical protein [Lactiplantibacillus brownii]
MLALTKGRHGVLITQTVVISDEVDYQIDLLTSRWSKHPYTVKITALTLTGHTVITVARFDHLATAQTAYDAYFTDLAQK